MVFVMTGYIILVGCSLLFMLISIYVKINNKLMIALYIIIVAFLAGIRDLSIPDTQGYVYLYQSYGSDFVSNLSLSYMEPGFVLLATAIKCIIGNKYQLFFFIITLINMYFILLGIKYFYKDELLTIYDVNSKGLKSILQIKQVKYIIPLIMYLIMFGYSFNFITIRIGLAFTLLFLAYVISSRKKGLALILWVVSVTMHFSVLLTLILIPFLFYKKPFSKQKYVLWLLIIPILWFIGYNNIFTDLFFNIATNIPLIYARFHPYINENMVISSGAFIRMAVYMILAVQMTINNKGETKYNFILKTYLLGLSIYALFFNIAIIGRTSEIFIAFAFIIPSYYLTFSKRKMSDVVMLIFYFTYFSLSTGRLLI